MMEEAFASIDTDGSGRLDRDEVRLGQYPIVTFQYS
jgi:hypothetical protein